MKPDLWGANINAYVYNRDSGTVAALKTWPGTAMALDTDGLYSISFNMNIINGWIIFNDGKNQTKGDPGFVLVNNGVYDVNGYKYTSTASVDANKRGDINIYTSKGVVYIASSVNSIIPIVSINGITRNQNITEGINIISDLPRGFYIVNGKKVIL